MAWQGRDVTMTFGGQELKTVVHVSYNPKPIEVETKHQFSFNSDSNFDFTSHVELNGAIQYRDGKKLKLKSMNLSGCETPFRYTFDCGSVLIASIMKTKGKQPRKVAVWREM